MYNTLSVNSLNWDIVYLPGFDDAFCPPTTAHVTSAPSVVEATFAGMASISFVSGFPFATICARVVGGTAVVVVVLVAFLDGLGVVVVVVVNLLVVVLTFVVVEGRFVGLVVKRGGFVVILLGGGFVILTGFVVGLVGFGLVTGFVDVVVTTGLLDGFAVVVLFCTAAVEAFCTDWNVVTFAGASVVGFFLTVVLGSFSLAFVVVTGFAVVVFVTLRGGSLGGMIARSMLLSMIS